MYLYNKNAPEYNCVAPVYLYKRQVPEGLPFAHPDTRDQDEKVLRSYLPRVLAILKNLRIRPPAAKAAPVPQVQAHTCPFAGSSPVIQPEFYGDFTSFKDGKTHSMRFIVSNVQRLLTQPKTFVIGFFSNLATSTEGVKQRVWSLDERLVGALGSFTCILGYATCRLDDGSYFNYVFLEDDKAVQKWRCLEKHNAAVTISPVYYDWVRINHAVIPCSLASMMDIEGAENKIEILRTKYFMYRDSKCVWRAIRKSKSDELFHSLPEHQPVSPFVFASFGDEEQYHLHRKAVEYIGKKSRLPVKMIDLAALEPLDGADASPSELSLIHKYNIDFAFTSRAIFASSFPNLVPIATPILDVNHPDANQIDDAAREDELYEDMVVASAWVHVQVQQLVRKAFATMHKHIEQRKEILNQLLYHKMVGVTFDDFAEERGWM